MHYFCIYIKNFLREEKTMSKGRVWPYAIGSAITLVFGFCVATIYVTEGSKIQESHMYMSKYQEADLHGNDLIENRIAFDAKYTIAYVTKNISTEHPVIQYKVTDKNSLAVNNASIEIAISRPETDQYDKHLENPTVKDGVYSFKVEKFPRAGVWNIIAKISVGDNTRFYNMKADTRTPSAFEF